MASLTTLTAPFDPLSADLPSAAVRCIECPWRPLDDKWWPEVAARATSWLDEHNAAARDAIWLLPFAALLPLARRALAQNGGWQMQVETVATLTQQLAPPGCGLASGVLGADLPANRLLVAQWLRRQDWADAWARRDPRAFARSVAALAQTAHTFGLRAAQRPPSERPRWWQMARAHLAANDGPGQLEQSLARLALDWAAASEPPNGYASDVLFRQPVSAWVALQAGGTDRAARAVLENAAARGVPALLLQADAPAERLFSLAAALPPPEEVIGADAEAQAQASAACVAAALAAQPQGQVAVVAQDRELVRRVRVLLERLNVPVIDDTGWRLATTRAAARAMALLQAARFWHRGQHNTGAARDAWLAWLKDDALGRADPAALDALEAQWRGRRLNPEEVAAAVGLEQRARQRLLPLMLSEGLDARRSLAQWLDILRSLWLGEQAQAALWRGDAAGRAVLKALRIEELDALTESAWREISANARQSLDDLIAWVDETLEEAIFVPPHCAEARVVMTPLARVMLRPFIAVVCPGADERHLGAVVEYPASLLGPALTRSLGLPDAAERREREALAFVHMLRAPRVTLLRHTAEGSEPLTPSALLQRLVLARQAAGLEASLPQATPHLPLRQWSAQPIAAPQPLADEAAWPASLSASAVQALRDCPYRFHARVLLRLHDAVELDAPADKRDFGLWLHALLWRFHHGRAPTVDAAADLLRLQTCAAQAQAELNLDEGRMLPFFASFSRLAPVYLHWLHAREAGGLVWRQGESDAQARPAAWRDIGLHGRLDRLDEDRLGGVQIVDYKTGSAGALKRQVANLLEDTQLAFYAALMVESGAASPSTLSAVYLALDEADGPQEIEHPQVGQTARQLIEHLGGELKRLHAGAPLLPLGQGDTCEWCEMRGLCQRDYWTSTGLTQATS